MVGNVNLYVVIICVFFPQWISENYSFQLKAFLLFIFMESKQSDYWFHCLGQCTTMSTLGICFIIYWFHPTHSHLSIPVTSNPLSSMIFTGHFVNFFSITPIHNTIPLLTFIMPNIWMFFTAPFTTLHDFFFFIISVFGLVFW